MKWTALNAFGGLVWLAGLFFAKGRDVPGLVDGGEHHIGVGILFGVVGLATLVWANIREA